MKPTLTKSVQNIEILNKLVSSGYYSGEIENSKFTFKRSAFPNNLGIFGTDNGNGKYNLKADFFMPMRICYYIILLMSLVFFTIFLIMQKWVSVLLIGIIVPIIVLSHNYKRKKELEIFTNKFLTFKNT